LPPPTASGTGGLTRHGSDAGRLSQLQRVHLELHGVGVGSLAWRPVIVP
jgi:hypothetical protein